LRPPQTVLPNRLDLRRPLPQSLQAKICGPRSSDLDSWMDRLQRAPGTCIPSGTRFRERTPRRLARRRQARHSRAMRPRWLAWAAFILGFSCHGFSRTHADQKKSQDAEHRPVSLAGFKLLDYSLFIPHTSEIEDGGKRLLVRATVGPKKISLACVFRRRRRASTSRSRLISRSRYGVDFPDR